MANVSVVLVEIAGEGPEAKEDFVAGLQGLFHVPESKAWQILATLPATLSKSVPEEEGRLIAEKIRSIGGVCRLQPVEPSVPAPPTPPGRTVRPEEPLEDVEPPKDVDAPEEVEVPEEVEAPAEDVVASPEEVEAREEIEEPAEDVVASPEEVEAREEVEAPAEDVEVAPAYSPRIVELRRPEAEGAGEARRESVASPGPRVEPGPGELRCPLCGTIQSASNRRCASCFQWLPEPPAGKHPVTEAREPVPRAVTRTPPAAASVVPPVAVREAVRRRPPLHPSVVAVSVILLLLGAGAVAWFALAFPRSTGRWMLAVAGVDALLAGLLWVRPDWVRPVVLVRAVTGLAAALWFGFGAGFPFLLQMQVVWGVALLVLGIGRGSIPKALLTGILTVAAVVGLAFLAGVVGTPASVALARIGSGVRQVEEGACDAALGDLREALAIAPRSRPDIQAKARVGIASAHMARNEFGPAIAELEEAARLDAGNAQASFLLAACYIHESRPEDAEGMLARVRELDPGYAGLEGLEAIVRQMPR